MALALACTMAGCASSTGTENGSGLGTSPTEPSQIGQDGRGPVRVTRVRVFMKEGRPQAYVEGEIGDGCSRLDSITQERTAKTVAITAAHGGTVRAESEGLDRGSEFIVELPATEAAVNRGESCPR